MSLPIDRTNDLIKAIAGHHGVSATPTATLKTSANLNVGESRKTERAHEFTETALEVTKRVGEMLKSVRKCEGRYVDFSGRGMGDDERDEVDGAVSEFLTTTLRRIDELKRDAVEDARRSRSGASFAAHKLGVVALLNDKLRALSSVVEVLRAARIRHAVSQRDQNRITYNASIARAQLVEQKRKRNEQLQQRKQSQGHGEKGTTTSGNMNDNIDLYNNTNDDADYDTEDTALMAELERENVSLVSELVETRERVRDAERTVQAISNMNAMFATRVLEQAKEIETLYSLAVDATHFVERGNAELRAMARSGHTAKYIVAVLALLLALALIILEWVGRRRYSLLR